MPELASITVFSSHPQFSTVLQLIAVHPEAAASTARSTQTLADESEANLRRVLTRLGNASTAYLRAIAKHLRATGGSQFVLRDLLPLTGYADLKSIRACNRNTSRAIHHEGVSLWSKKWDRATSCQTFIVSAKMREALLEVFASE